MASMLRSMKTSPVTTGQVASEAKASGERLMAAVPMGLASRVSSEVRASGM